MIPCDQSLLPQSYLCEPSDLASKASLYSDSLYVHSLLWDMGSHYRGPELTSKSGFSENFSDCWLGWKQEGPLWRGCLKNLASALGLWKVFCKLFLVLSQLSFWFLWTYDMSTKTSKDLMIACLWWIHSWLYRPNFFTSPPQLRNSYFHSVHLHLSVIIGLSPILFIPKLQKQRTF